MYNFGLYHWRRHRLTSAISTTGLVVAGTVWTRSENRVVRMLAGAIGLGAVALAVRTTWKLSHPLPWAIDREKYDLLASLLPLDDGGRLLDVGCGTGRSMVGLAPHFGPDWSVTGLDVFDARIVLGNSPGRALDNAEAAGLSPTIVAGDATRLPVQDRSQDLVVVGRLLHDLPEAEARSVLAESRRVLRPDGHLGAIELPIIPGDADADPLSYWTGLLRDAGFEVTETARCPWKDDREHVVLAATPDEE